MTSAFDAEYWNKRYQNGASGWDIGYVSTPLRSYFDQLNNKELRILIPGAGNAYEADYLHRLGYLHTHVLDISKVVIQNFLDKYPEFPKEHVFQRDFWQHPNSYDLIIEQTFFCALDPKLRNAYVEKMRTLLNPKGKLVGLLWKSQMSGKHPPFGGSKVEYEHLFQKHFDIVTMEEAYNSIPQRTGTELFINLCIK